MEKLKSKNKIESVLLFPRIKALKHLDLSHFCDLLSNQLTFLHN